MNDEKTSVIADSSGLISLISVTDTNHEIAIQAVKDFGNIGGSIIIPSDVFSETLNTIGKKIGHDIAIIAGQEIGASNTYVVIETNESLRQQAFELFKKQPASVRFTDCVVMAFADKFSTKAIFGFNHVFKKNGYTRLGFDKP